eukprot:7665045-Pyramimonas_sp.AAC.1
MDEAQAAGATTARGETPCPQATTSTDAPTHRLRLSAFQPVASYQSSSLLIAETRAPLSSATALFAPCVL